MSGSVEVSGATSFSFGLCGVAPYTAASDHRTLFFGESLMTTRRTLMHTTRAMRWSLPKVARWAGSVAIALAFVGCGDDDTSNGNTCSDDEACAVGQICLASGNCGELPCASNSDCLNGQQACVTIDNASVCSLAECGCITCDACPVGEICGDDGTCGPGVIGQCTGPQDCADGQVCDGGQCRACQGDECGTPADCNLDGCDAGFTCNTATGVCEEDVVTPTGTPCQSCSTADECGDGWKCAPLINGNSCLPPCASNDDCSTGWSCQAGNCTPENFNCSGCITDGCPAGQACSPGSNACVGAAAVCDSCASDWECGDGKACNGGVCVTRCAGGVCPSGGTCGATANGVSTCSDECADVCNPVCSGATPHCLEGGCVECRDSTDCAGDSVCTNNTCQSASGNCSGATPYELNGACVECLTNDHCGALFCNTGTGSCVNDTCASCAAPYPACTQVGSDWYCVQCATDADCGAGGVCNTSTFACEGGTVTPTDACETDADCDASGTGFTLQCHVPTGLCYDTGGGCDDVKAFCPGADGQVRECASLLDAFAGGALPPLPGGGAGGIPGSCACEGSSLTGNDTCLGASCVDFGFLLAILGGGGTPTGSTPNAICFSLGF